ncbi:MAG: ABC transporter permease [Planctomycetes bacterium]|nr:ABC transporter permease [Planctomycetota bacterium]
MPRARVVRAYVADAKYESVRMLRAPAFGIPFLLLPIALYLLFAVVLFGEAIRADPSGGRFVFSGFAVFGVVGPALFGFGAVLAIERDQGLLTLKRALPAPPGSFLIAKMIMAVLFAGIVMITMLAAALSIGHVPLSIGRALAVSVVGLLGALPFCAIGLLIGTIASGRAAPAFVNLVYFPMLYLSGLWFPLPGVLKTFAPVWPTYHLMQLMLRAAGAVSTGSVIAHVAVLAGVTLVFAALAMRRLARQA